jgi:RNA polymerase sigma factor for flagellar operon FliA
VNPGGSAMGDRAAVAYAAAGSDTRQARIEAHLGVLGRMARRIHSTLPHGAVELDELLSWGAIGLCQAIDTYDPGRGVPLEPFVRVSIRHAILDGLRENDRMPRRMREKERRLREAVSSLEQTLMRSPTQEEVAQALGGDEASVSEHYAALAYASLGSLDEESSGSDEGGDARIERIADQGAQSPVERVEDDEERGQLVAALSRLTERERKILWAVYQEDYTLTEVAKALRLSVSQVGRIHAHAILRLRGLMSRYVAQSRRDTPQAPRAASDRPSAQAGSVPQGRAPPAQTIGRMRTATPRVRTRCP